MKKVFGFFKRASCSVTRFFKNIWNSVYFFFVRKLMGIRSFFGRRVAAIKLFFHNKHVSFYTWIINFLVFHCQKYMLKLIHLKGLDPNPPPPPPPPEPEVRRPQFYMPYVPAWVSESFKNPGKHPLYGGRTAAKPEYLPKTSDLPKTPELQVTGSEFNQFFVEAPPASRGSLHDVITKEQKDRALEARLTELTEKLKDDALEDLIEKLKDE